MITLYRPMRLPTVAVLQSYLNQQDQNQYISVDGIFGPQTQTAVRQFQEQQRLPRTGRVNYDIWQRVVGSEWQIIDSVDRADPRVRDDLDLAPYGQTVLNQFGMSFGTPHVINSVRGRARTGQVVLLRFHGHGSPGHMIVSSGVQDAGSSFAHVYPERFYQLLRQLRPIFAPFGSVELHGCRVGQGRRGRLLLSRMANALGVPVTGALNYQQGGGTATYQFEGATCTMCPNGQSLPQWARITCQSSRRRPNVCV